MSFKEIVKSSQKYFPDLKIEYKDKSLLMKIIAKILFFNKKFMTNYVTTIGSTIYYPNEFFVNSRSLSSIIILLHELVHISDSNKISKPVFSFLYLFPQILTLLFIPFLFINFKISLLCLLFVLPIPAIFRAYFEMRAYFVSLYCLKHIGDKLKFNVHFEKEASFFMAQFKGPYYYFMWPFNIDKQFNKAIVKIKNGDKPFEAPIFDVIDDLISQM